MPVYKYVALNSEMKISRGKIFAQDPNELVNILKQEQLELLKYKSIKIHLTLSKVQDKDLIQICKHMSIMDKSGIHILESLKLLQENIHNPILKNALQDVYGCVKSGSTLYNAINRYKNIFSPVFLALIDLGEKSGNLNESLDYASEYMKWRMDFASQIKKITIMPLFSTVLSLIMSGGIVTSIMPKFVKNFTNNGTELPISTAMLMGIADFISGHWIVMFASIIGIIIIVTILYKYLEKCREIIDRIVIKLPLFGKLLYKANIALFCKVFYITHTTGAKEIDSLKLSCSAVTNSYLESKLKKAIPMVIEGSTISHALKSCVNFSKSALHMFSIGEKGGSLDQALKNLNEVYAQELEDMKDSMMPMIKIFLFLFNTSIVGTVVLTFVNTMYGSLQGM